MSGTNINRNKVDHVAVMVGEKDPNYKVDHQRENVRRLRELEKKKQEEKVTKEYEQANSKPPKNPKYSNVESRVMKPKTSNTTGATANARAPNSGAQARAAGDGHKPGEIPKYLQKYQKEWSEQARLQKEREEAERLKSRAPPGCRLVQPEEKEAILKDLKNNLAETIKELNTVPMRNDSLSVRNRSTELDTRILELQKAIEQFEKPEVWIREDL